MKLLIAGSRSIDDYDILKNIMLSFGLKPATIISGKASGVDSLAERYAREHGIQFKGFPANWKEYGKAAGPIRNSKMLKHADMVLVIWDGKSKGTFDTITKAKKLQIPLILVRMEE